MAKANWVDYNRKFKDVEGYAVVMRKLKVECPNCGHKVIFISGVDRNICSWCRNYVYRDKAAEFRYKMQKELRKVNNER